jgi:hypothetical protein
MSFLKKRDSESSVRMERNTPPPVLASNTLDDNRRLRVSTERDMRIPANQEMKLPGPAYRQALNLAWYRAGRHPVRRDGVRSGQKLRHPPLRYPDTLKL